MPNLIATTPLEGGRKNLLPSREAFESILHELGIDFTFSKSSALGPVPTWTLKIPAGANPVIGIPSEGICASTDYSFSVYIWAEEPLLSNYRLLLSGNDERVIKRCKVSAKPTRQELSHRFSAPPGDLVASLDLTIQRMKLPPLVHLAFPMLEESLFPASPIELGSTRAPEYLSFERESFFVRDQGTISICFIPNWNGHELSEAANPALISCFSDDLQNGVAIYSSGRRNGRLTAFIRKNGTDTHVESSVVPLREEVYSVALRWAGGIADFIVNGWIVASASQIGFPFAEKLGDRVHVGEHPKVPHSGLFAEIIKVEAWRTWNSDGTIRAFLFEALPSFFPHFRNAGQALEHERLEHFSAGSWTMPIARALLCYPDLWQENPPPWLLEEASIREGDFRDELVRLLGGVGLVGDIPLTVAAEGHSSQGRTDLVITIGRRRIRVECKIWGRHDYAHVPEKPLKYFTSTDRAGGVVMINPRKRKHIGDDYRHNVRESPTSCTAIVDLPFGESMPDHFVSLHDLPDGSKAEVLHIVIDKFGPFTV